MVPSELTTEIAARLRKSVDWLAGEIGPRHLRLPQTIIVTAEWIERELTGFGYQVRKETYAAGEHAVSNLIVEHRGTRHPEQVLIVGAHYDTVSTTPGADDNASAVAVLLEIACLLSREKFRKTVRLVFFPCEEAPHFHLGEMGSQVHARKCREQNERIIGMLCLEMVGYFVSGAASQRLPDGIPKWLHWVFPKQGNFLAAVANPRSWWLLLRFRFGFKKGSRFPLFTIALPEKIREIRLSDHSNFWDQGYPALMLTDTSFLRNPHYHQPTDTPETLDYTAMAALVPGLCQAVCHLARRSS